MLKKYNVYQEETYSPLVRAGDFLYTSHQGGGQHSDSTAVQVAACLESLRNALALAGATLDDVVQVNLLLKNASDFEEAQQVFPRFFHNGFPARTTYITDFVAPMILAQVDAIAYKKLEG